MSKSINTLLETITYIVIIMLSIASAVTIIKVGGRYRDYLVEKMNTKASSQYTFAYGNTEYLLSAENVYTDIMAEPRAIVIKIDGHDLNAAQLQKAKELNVDGIRKVRDVLGSKNYKRVLMYDMAGNVVAINYIGEP